MSSLNLCPECTIGLGDLHIHTSASDGCFSPTEIITLAQNKGLKYISITDHDTIAGLQQLPSSIGNKSLVIIPGIELSTEFRGHEVHILGYAFDINQGDLQKNIALLAASREQRVRNIIHKLQTIGYTITFEDVERHSAHSSSLGRPHIALALIEKGVVPNMSTAFKKLLNKGCPGYMPRQRLSPRDAVKLILSAGGVPVLAHPGNYFSDALFVHLLKAGLRGIEVFYPQHGEREQRYFYTLAKENSLLITGGSDFHGHGRADAPFFGNIPVPAATYQYLAENHKS